MEFIILIISIILINNFISENRKQNQTKKINIDEKISVENYKKTKAILNSINFNTITRAELNKIIDKLAQIDNSEFYEEVKNTDFTILKSSLIEMRDSINAIDLDSKTAISTRELYKDVLTDEQMEQAEDKINHVEQQEDENLIDDIVIGTLASMHINNKDNRIENKRKLLQDLEREHKFQRGYMPYWDTEERLYDKYKNDKEKYLDAKIRELKGKNLSQDMYITEDEKDI